MKKKIIINSISALFWLSVWQLSALAVGNALLLPSPASVVLRIFELAGTSVFWETVVLSLVRVSLGIVISLVMGIVFAILCSRSLLTNAIFLPLINVIKATPVASFIMLALLWLNRDLLPVFITVLIALPVVFANITGGIGAIDRGLIQVTKSFDFPFWRRLKRLYVPSVYPYFISACRSSLGLAWKAGIAAEVLAVPAMSIGKMIYSSKLYLETTDLFAWSAVVIILSVIIESVLVGAVAHAGRHFERQAGSE